MCIACTVSNVCLDGNVRQNNNMQRLTPVRTMRSAVTAEDVLRFSWQNNVETYDIIRRVLFDIYSKYYFKRMQSILYM